MKYKQVWNGRDWIRVELCENAVRNTDINYGHGIGVYQCYDNPSKFSVTIHYTNCMGDEFDQDTMRLCEECLQVLRKSARRNGYRIESARINGGKRG